MSTSKKNPFQEFQLRNIQTKNTASLLQINKLMELEQVTNTYQASIDETNTHIYQEKDK